MEGFARMSSFSPKTSLTKEEIKIVPQSEKNYLKSLCSLNMLSIYNLICPSESMLLWHFTEIMSLDFMHINFM